MVDCLGCPLVDPERLLRTLLNPQFSRGITVFILKPLGRKPQSAIINCSVEALETPANPSAEIIFPVQFRVLGGE